MLCLIGTSSLLSLCTASNSLCCYSSVRVEVSTVSMHVVEESVLKVIATQQAVGTHSLTSLYAIDHTQHLDFSLQAESLHIQG